MIALVCTVKHLAYMVLGWGWLKNQLLIFSDDLIEEPRLVAEIKWFFKKNKDKIRWDVLNLNPRIFKYNYKQMKQNCMLFKEDLMKNRFHPRNIPKFKDWKVNGFNSDSE